MKIWYLTSEFPPSYGGGIGMYVDIISRLMAKEENDVVVFVRDDKSSETILSPHLKHVRFKAGEGEEYSRMGYWTALAYQYCREVFKLIDAEGAPDIIETQEYSAIGYYVLQYKYLGDPRLKNVKIVVHMHTPTFELCKINRTPEYRFPEYWIGKMEKYCIKAADGLVTQSKFLKKQLGGYSSQEINVIPLPYQLREKDIVSYQCGDYLLYAGRIEWRKGIAQFISEMDKLWTQGEKTKLVALGGDTFFAPKDCQLREFLKRKYAHRIQEGLLEFTDSVPPEELNRMMVKARAVVVPSTYENYPYTCVIAMSLGMPMLVSKQGGQAEMVKENGVNGFIFDWDKPGDCVEKIKDLLGLDKIELYEMSNRAQARIESLCNFEKNARLRMDFYHSVLQSPARKAEYPFLGAVPRTPLPKDIEIGTQGMLSVIIPYYNLGKTIEETLRSVLQITYDNYEIILVNDGSTDAASIEKLAELKDKYSALQVVTIPNGGLANARNVGASYAKGEYLAFLDADNMVKPEFYERCIQVLGRYDNVSFVYSWLQYFEESSDVWTTFDTTLPYMLMANMLDALAVVRRADFLAFGKNRPVMEYGMEDYDGWLGMLENGRMGVCIPEPLCLYRVRSDSMSHAMNHPACRMYLYEVLQSGHRKLYERYAGDIYNLMLSNGSCMTWGSPTQQYYPTGPLDAYGMLGQLQAAHAQLNELQAELTRQKNTRWYRLQLKYAHFVNETAVGRFLRYRLAAPLHWIRRRLRK